MGTLVGFGSLANIPRALLVWCSSPGWCSPRARECPVRPLQEYGEAGSAPRTARAYA
jgi:hypothetical protein